MIKPNEYTNVDLSVIGLSVDIMDILLEDNIVKYHTLLRQIVVHKGENAKENFLFAMSFLYALGKIKYVRAMDAVQLIQVKEEK
jgi:hypothetical protein